jgi:hypothetical protein
MSMFLIITLHMYDVIAEGRMKQYWLFQKMLTGIQFPKLLCPVLNQLTEDRP